MKRLEEHEWARRMRRQRVQVSDELSKIYCDDEDNGVHVQLRAHDLNFHHFGFVHNCDDLNGILLV